jgi:hypothetical protein
MYDSDANFLKHRVTKHEDPTKRYTSKVMDGGTVARTDRGPRSEIIRSARVGRNQPGSEHSRTVGWPQGRQMTIANAAVTLGVDVDVTPCAALVCRRPGEPHRQARRTDHRGDLPVTQSCLGLQPQHLTNLAHGQPRLRHRRPPRETPRSGHGNGLSCRPSAGPA